MDEYKNRLREALDLRGMRQVELSEKTGLSAPQINSWLKQKWQPKSDALYKMAKVLDVSELWLAGVEGVPMERPVEQKKAEELAEMINALRDNDRLRDMVNILISLSPEQLDGIEPIIRQLSNIIK